MSRPIRVATTGTAVSAPIPVDVNRQAPFNVGLVADVTGTVVYTVEYTAADLWGAATFNPAAATWFPVSGGMTGASTDQALTFTTPCTAIRLNQASGAGNVVLTLIQGGI